MGHLDAFSTFAFHTLSPIIMLTYLNISKTSACNREVSQCAIHFTHVKELRISSTSAHMQRDTSSCLLHVSQERSRCRTPSDRDKCRPAWFCAQLHVLWAHQRLINITGSPVIPLCSSVYTQLLLHLTACTAGHFQQVAVVSISPKGKLDSVWESVIMCLCLPSPI